MRRLHGLGAAALVAAAGALGLQSLSGVSDGPDRRGIPAAPMAGRPTAVDSGAMPTPPDRRDALRGTAVDGAVHLDAQGRPLADRALRRLFDHFLIRTGELPPAHIREALRQHLRTRLTAAALARVLAWFDVYLAVQQECAALPASGDPLADLERRRAMRIRRLGPAVAQAWFGAEDAALAEAIARRQARAGGETLVPGGAPDDIDDPQARAALDVQAWVEHQRLDRAARARLREELWGAPAARRLAALDARRAQWRQRLQQYARARARLMDDPSLDDSQRQRALERLLEPFDANERLRVDVLTRHGRLP